MYFLSPIWFFAAAAIIIPVVIHLWNIKEGKTLKVGSIALMEASSRKPSRSLKLIDLLLLLVRCLLLLVLAMVLAVPFIRKNPDNAKVKGWLLIPKEDFKEAYQKFKPQADSLTKAGYEFHYFDAGFPKADLAQLSADTSITFSKTQSYWSLLAQLDQTVNGLPVYLITTNELKNFSGEKSETALNIHWKTYTPADSTVTWIQSAWFTTNNDVRVVQCISKPSGTTYTEQTVSSGQQKSAIYNVSVSSGQPVISLKNNNQPPVAIDTAALKIAVFADKNTLDAGYLKAALESVAQFTQRKIVISNYANGAKQDWLFWLSDKSIDQAAIANCKNVFAYGSGKINPVSSWISSDNEYSVSAGQQTVALYKEVNEKIKGETIWHDGFNNPVLSLDEQGQTAVYHFTSRFNPSWSDLVWSPVFPKMMMQLIIKNRSTVKSDQYDKRVMAEKQIQPEMISQNHTVQSIGNNNRELTNYFWIALALLFLTERWLAHRNPVIVKKEVLQNG